MLAVGPVLVLMILAGVAVAASALLAGPVRHVEHLGEQLSSLTEAGNDLAFALGSLRGNQEVLGDIVPGRPSR